MKPSDNKYNTRKQELFAQITELIKEFGYANLTVRGICNSLGISTGTFYHYFPEKGDLALVLFSAIDNYFNTKVTLKFGSNEIENLILFCNEYANFVVRNGVETCRCISIAPLNSKDSNYLDENRNLFQILLNILTQGVEKKQFSDTLNPQATTRMLLVLLRGYSSDWAKRNGNYDLVDALEGFIRLFMKSLL